MVYAVRLLKFWLAQDVIVDLLVSQAAMMVWQGGYSCQCNPANRILATVFARDKGAANLSSLGRCFRYFSQWFLSHSGYDRHAFTALA